MSHRPQRKVANLTPCLAAVAQMGSTSSCNSDFIFHDDSLSSDLLPPLHVGGAPLVVDVEECLTRALGDGVDLLVIELVTHNPVRLGVKS